MADSKESKNDTNPEVGWMAGGKKLPGIGVFTHNAPDLITEFGTLQSKK